MSKEENLQHAKILSILNGWLDLPKEAPTPIPTAPEYVYYLAALDTLLVVEEGPLNEMAKSSSAVYLGEL